MTKTNEKVVILEHYRQIKDKLDENIAEAKKLAYFKRLDSFYEEVEPVDIEFKQIEFEKPVFKDRLTMIIHELETGDLQRSVLALFGDKADKENE